MANTRAQIKVAVNDNTGRGAEKVTLIERLADEALKVAVQAHPFRDSRTLNSDIDITENATSVSISTISNLVHIVTARIVQADGSLNTPLPLKDEVWWARNVINAEDNMKGWPAVGMRRGAYIMLDKHAESGLTLRLVVSTEQIFDGDDNACPIGILDTFIIQYITAFIFLSIEASEQFSYWKHLALGWKWDDGIIGGSLKHAIDSDSADIAEEMVVEGPPVERRDGISLHAGDYGDIRLRY